MQPMDVEGARPSSPPSSGLPPSRPTGPFGGTGQVFHSVSTPISIRGTQDPFQQKRMSASQVMTTSSPFIQARASSSSSPFTTTSESAPAGYPKSVPSRRISLSIPKPEPRPDVHMLSSPLANDSSSSLTAPSVDLSSHAVIPEALPSLTPSYPAALFGGLSSDDEHVTVWEPRTGKTVAGNAAPYRRNLSTWLETHEGWEEKADELKSSKRRAAARRSKLAATCFASLCAFPVAKVLADDALIKFKDSKAPAPTGSLSDWSPDDYVRLQEILFRVGRDGHTKQRENLPLAADRWDRVVQNLGPNKKATDILYLSHHMLLCGIQKSSHELLAVGNGGSSASTGAIGIPGRTEHTPGIHSPASASYSSYEQSAAWRGPGSFGANSLPSMASGGLSAITNSFRTPKEPRITVWCPDTGKTISGNAAPCRRNLETWMAHHPGWYPKAETQLSSSRRTRNKKGSRPMSVPGGSAGSMGISFGHSAGAPTSLDGQSPVFCDAVQGLLGLGTSVGSYNSIGAGGSMLLASGIGKRSQSARGGREGAKKGTFTSSVSSSSGGDIETDSSDDEQDDDIKMDVR